MNDIATPGYTNPARYLHWAIAGMIVLQFALSSLAEQAGDAGETLRQLALLANHKSVGMTVLMVAVVRVVWRLTHPPPNHALTMPAWQRYGASAAHLGLYVLLFAMPVTGWLMSSASAYSVSWFNLFAIPDLVDADTALKELLETVHETLAYSLAAIASLHIGAALWHHFKDKDDVLRRMSSVGSVMVGVVVVVVGLSALALFGSGGQGAASAVVDAPVTSEAAVKVSGLPQWQIDYSKSYIRFSAEQAGAEFEGSFAGWRGAIQFDPKDLPASVADVEIDLTSVTTGDRDRDATLSQAEWFGGGVARFTASGFEATGADDFRTVEAILSFGAGAQPVEFVFSVISEGSNRVLDGKAHLDRIALGVGTGEWTDTTWVGQFVEVEVKVTAAR